MYPMSDKPTRQQIAVDAAPLARKLDAIMASQRAQTEHHGRRVFNFNQDWDFLLGEPAASPLDSRDGELSWQRVHLPHTPVLEHLNASGGRNFQGVCWYRKTFELDPAKAQRLVYL